MHLSDVTRILKTRSEIAVFANRPNDDYDILDDIPSIDDLRQKSYYVNVMTSLMPESATTAGTRNQNATTPSFYDIPPFKSRYAKRPLPPVPPTPTLPSSSSLSLMTVASTPALSMAGNTIVTYTMLY